MPWKFFGSDGYRLPPIEITSAEAADIVMFAGPVGAGASGSLAQAQTAPTGYLFCNGATIDKSTNVEYTDLYNLLTKSGTVGLFGAFTANTARLPDYRDKFVQGSASGANVGANSSTSTHFHSVASHYHALLNHVHGSYDSHNHDMTHFHYVAAHTHGVGTLYMANDSATRPSDPTGSPKVSVAPGNHAHTLSGSSGSMVYYAGPGGTTGPVSELVMNTNASDIGATTGTSAHNSGSTSYNTDTKSTLPVYRAINFMIKV